MSLETSPQSENMFALFEQFSSEAEDIVLERNEAGEILAPNGLPSELQEHELLCKIIRTQGFKEWFGDWEKDSSSASKAVYPTTGEPRIVFHGTPASISLTEGLRPVGKGSLLFFSNNSWDAFEYGKNSLLGGRAVLYPCFVNIREPTTDPNYESGDGLIREDGFTAPYIYFGVKSKDQVLHIALNSIIHKPS